MLDGPSSRVNFFYLFHRAFTPYRTCGKLVPNLVAQRFDLSFIYFFVTLAALLALAIWLGQRLRQQTRTRLLIALHQAADSQEVTLRALRERLRVVETTLDDSAIDFSGLPADVTPTFKVALRKMLEFRFWLRDQAPEASVPELRSALNNLQASQSALKQQTLQLATAQHDLRTAESKLSEKLQRHP